MDAESERIFARMQLHHLLETHPDWSDQRLAHETGKSESWVLKWRPRLGAVREPYISYVPQPIDKRRSSGNTQGAQTDKCFIRNGGLSDSCRFR